MSSAIQKLTAAVRRIAELSDDEGYGSPIAGARNRSANRIRSIESLQIAERYNNTPSKEQLALASRLKALMVVDEQANAGGELRDALRGFAGELERLRAALPSLSAAAAVEAGVRARALADEAEGRP